MGGHGGLNILPQKRWNVYNFDNREKVKKDEEEAAEKERQVEEEQMRRDGEIRRQILLDRARQRRGELASKEQPQLAAQAQPQLPSSPSSSEIPSTLPPPPPTSTAHSALDGAQKVAVSPEGGEAQPTGDSREVSAREARFRLFAEEEDKACLASVGARGSRPAFVSRPEATAKKARELDAKAQEDEKYRLGYNISKPWYAEKVRVLPSGPVPSFGPASPAAPLPSLVPSKRQEGAAPEVPKQARAEEDRMPPKHKRKEKARKRDEDKHKHKRKHKARDHDRDSDSDSDRESRKRKHKRERETNSDEERRQKAEAVERLRQERVAREHRERLRATKLMVGHGQARGGAAPVPAVGHTATRPVANSRGYNSTYGYGR